jgi:hypothetical protein
LAWVCTITACGRIDYELLSGTGDDAGQRFDGGSDMDASSVGDGGRPDDGERPSDGGGPGDGAVMDDGSTMPRDASCGTASAAACVSQVVRLDGTNGFFRYFTAGADDNVQLGCTPSSDAHDYVVHYRTDLAGRYTFRITSDFEAAAALRDSCQGTDRVCRPLEPDVTETLTEDLTVGSELYLALEGRGPICGGIEVRIETPEG